MIQDFHSSITILKNGKVRVVETILADFGSLSMHGITRTIPTDGIKFRLLEVKQDGEQATVETSSSPSEFSLRIGEENVLISSSHLYEIAYEVGKVEFNTMINAQIRLLRFELQAQRYLFNIYEKQVELEEILGRFLAFHDLEDKRS